MLGSFDAGDGLHDGRFAMRDMPNNSDVDGGLPADDLSRFNVKTFNILVLLRFQ